MKVTYSQSFGDREISCSIEYDPKSQPETQEAAKIIQKVETAIAHCKSTE